MKTAALSVAAAAVVGFSLFVSIPSMAQSQKLGVGNADRHPGGGAAGFRGGRGGGPIANVPADGGGPRFRGAGRGGAAVVRGGRGGGWRGAGPGPGPRYYGHAHRHAGPGAALGAAALGLAAGAILGAPAYVDEPDIYADECMQQVWLHGAWRWRNVCD